MFILSSGSPPRHYINGNYIPYIVLCWVFILTSAVLILNYLGHFVLPSHPLNHLAIKSNLFCLLHTLYIHLLLSIPIGTHLVQALTKLCLYYCYSLLSVPHWLWIIHSLKLIPGISSYLIRASHFFLDAITETVLTCSIVQCILIDSLYTYLPYLTEAVSSLRIVSSFLYHQCLALLGTLRAW